MRPGAWAEANQLFEEWADRPEQELGPFLASLQSTDPMLAQLVADLLEADRNAEQIDCIDMTSVLAWLETEDGPDPWLGQQLGPYRIDSLLGAGGMGSVYLAHHENFQGPAAVKILSDSLSPDRRLRFEYEKRHLGRLSHPAIARIFHADVHTDGTLFFAMEYVDGEQVTQYCERTSLPLRDRLQLFQQITEAVQAAHSKGIIHRDLKPSNILVTNDGAVKLLDFGIAEQADATPESALRFISLPYASPEYEQAQPTVASDLYSLGILLFELIAGKLPFPTEGRSAQQVRASVRAGHFPALSSLCPSDRLHDLTSVQWREADYICRKATELIPEQRYATAESLARDVTALLDGAALVLPSSPILYRQRKFVRRNRVASVLSLAFFLLLFGTVSTYTWQLRKARNAAVAAAQHAEKLAKFDQQMFDFVGSNSGPVQDVTALGMIDRSIPLIEAVRDDPATQSELYNFVGSDYADLGAYEKAETVLNRALAIDGKNYGADSVQTAATLVLVSQVAGMQSHVQEAEQLAERAYAIDTRKFKPYERPRLESEEALAEAHYGLNENDQAVTLERSLLPRIQGEENLSLRSTALNTLGMALVSLGRDDEALIANQNSLDIDRKLFGDTSPNVAVHLLTIADIQSRREEFTAAAQNCQQAVQLLSRWFGPNDPQTADAEVSLAEALQLSGHLQQAIPLLEAAIPAEHKIWSDNTPQLARAYLVLGRTERALGHYAEARTYLKKTLAAYRVLDQKGSMRTATVLSALARANFDNRLYIEADSEAHEALAMYSNTLGPSDPYTLRTLLLSGRIHKAERHNAEARAAFQTVCNQEPSSQAPEIHQQACADLQTLDSLSKN